MKKVSFSSVGKNRYEDGWLLPEGALDRLVGRLCTLIDAAGLKDSQERSIKDLIKQNVRSQFSKDYGSVYISEKLNLVLVSLDAELWNQRSVLPAKENNEGEYELIFTPTVK